MAVILIVDDDPKIRKLEDIYLRSEGFDTLFAGDGIQALGILEKNRVDLIVADILMPNMDGENLVRLLRKHHLNIPVLVVTSKSTFDDKRKLFAVGADDYLIKPVDLEELVMRIRAILRRCNISCEKQLRIEDRALAVQLGVIDSEQAEVLDAETIQKKLGLRVGQLKAWLDGVSEPYLLDAIYDVAMTMDLPASKLQLLQERMPDREFIQAE